jgi:hypothetical protein
LESYLPSSCTRRNIRVRQLPLRDADFQPPTCSVVLRLPHGSRKSFKTLKTSFPVPNKNENSHWVTQKERNYQMLLCQEPNRTWPFLLLQRTNQPNRSIITIRHKDVNTRKWKCTSCHPANPDVPMTQSPQNVKVGSKHNCKEFTQHINDLWNYWQWCQYFVSTDTIHRRERGDPILSSQQLTHSVIRK